MKWVDYREKLGIGFNDTDKYYALKNKLIVGLSLFHSHYTQNDYRLYSMMVGEKTSYHPDAIQGVAESIEKHAGSIKAMISKYVAFINTFSISKSYNCNWKGRTIPVKNAVLSLLTDSLDELNIPFQMIVDDDGIFVFPKGAAELDNALVSEPLEWLSDYPKAHKTFVIALTQYSEGVYVRDVADNLRKALEAFLQEFLENDKNLENNKNEICRYLGTQGVDAGIAGLFQPLINAYKNINDRIAKHNDAVDAKLLEFLLYQTGLLIRMVLVVKQSIGDS